jgi:hypothetical protein
LPGFEVTILSDRAAPEECPRRQLDGGGEHWAVIESPIESQAYLAVLTTIVNGPPNGQIEGLLSWTYASHTATT